MNLIKECFVEDCSAFSERLVEIGFTNDQMVNFLPEAASRISYAAHKTGVFQTMSHLMSGREYELLRTIDVAAMAKKSGLNSYMLVSGFHAIAPVLLQAYTQRRKNSPGSGALAA